MKTPKITTTLLCATFALFTLNAAHATDIPGSLTVGANNTASGTNAAAFGIYSTASGDESAAFGEGGLASGYSSFAVNGQAKSEYSVALGGLTNYGSYYDGSSFTANSGTTGGGVGSETGANAALNYGRALGGANFATNSAQTTINAVYSSAFNHAQVTSFYSSAFNSGKAQASYSAAFGYGTLATARNQIVVGQFNLTSGTQGTYNPVWGYYTGIPLTDGLLVVGCGTDDTHRANALNVTRGGQVLVKPSGDLSMGSFTTGQQP